jgi:pyruvate/2-oxoglutarate dehydrogenase complex dihydrolipoamide acyltransferase (E2) component
MTANPAHYAVLPFPPERQLTIEGGRLAARKHTVVGLVEVDVTRARQFIRRHKERTGEPLSFTAFVIACLGRAVAENRFVHACRDWRNRLILFDDVDVNMIVEIERDGRKQVLPHIIRAANRRSFAEIHADIRAVQARPEASREFGLRWFVRLPRLVRDVFYALVFRSPGWLKTSFGTVGVTAVGMFGHGGGWAIPFNGHTLDVALGGIAEKPGVVAGRIEIREYLCLTLMFDHDLVDGAPAARFTQRFQELLEAGDGLCPPAPGGPGDRSPGQEVSHVAGGHT